MLCAPRRRPSRRRVPYLRPLLALIPLAALVLAGPVRVTANPESQLRSAWQKARDVGAYSFATTVTQTTVPAPLLGNAGRQPEVKTLYLEGEVDGATDLLRLWLWEGAPESFDRDVALELKVTDGQTYARRKGADWEAIGQVSGLFAPGNDAAAFLAVASGSSWVERTTRSLPGYQPAVFDHYRFTVDDEALTRRLREDLQRELDRRAKLPAGLQPAMAGLFTDSIGRGQAWVDDQGLPARLQLDFEWPEDNGGARRSARILTDFKDFDRSRLTPAFAEAPASWLAGSLKSAWHLADRRDLGRQLALLGSVAFTVALVWQLRRRNRYGQVAILTAVAILLSPVASIVQAQDMPRMRRSSGTWSVAWFAGDRKLARQSIRALSVNRFERSLQVVDSRFLVGDKCGRSKFVKQLSQVDRGAFTPVFLLASSEPGIAAIANLQLQATGPHLDLPPTSADTLVTDGIALVSVDELDAAALRGVTGFELRLKNRLLGFVSLSPVPTAKITAEGGFDLPPDFVWSNAADEELNERLNRLMNGD